MIASCGSDPRDLIYEKLHRPFTGDVTFSHFPPNIPLEKNTTLYVNYAGEVPKVSEKQFFAGSSTDPAGRFSVCVCLASYADWNQQQEKKQFQKPTTLDRSNPLWLHNLRLPGSSVLTVRRGLKAFLRLGVASVRVYDNRSNVSELINASNSTKEQRVDAEKRKIKAYCVVKTKTGILHALKHYGPCCLVVLPHYHEGSFPWISSEKHFLKQYSQLTQRCWLIVGAGSKGFILRNTCFDLHSTDLTEKVIPFEDFDLYKIGDVFALLNDKDILEQDINIHESTTLIQQKQNPFALDTAYQVNEPSASASSSSTSKKQKQKRSYHEKANFSSSSSESENDLEEEDEAASTARTSSSSSFSKKKRKKVKWNHLFRSIVSNFQTMKQQKKRMSRLQEGLEQKFDIPESDIEGIQEEYNLSKHMCMDEMFTLCNSLLDLQMSSDEEEEEYETDKVVHEEELNSQHYFRLNTMAVNSSVTDTQSAIRHAHANPAVRFGFRIFHRLFPEFKVHEMKKNSLSFSGARIKTPEDHKEYQTYLSLKKKFEEHSPPFSGAVMDMTALTLHNALRGVHPNATKLEIVNHLINTYSDFYANKIKLQVVDFLKKNLKQPEIQLSHPFRTKNSASATPPPPSSSTQPHPQHTTTTKIEEVTEEASTETASTSSSRSLTDSLTSIQLRRKQLSQS